MNSLVKKIRNLPRSYSVILSAGVVILTSSVVYPIASDNSETRKEKLNGLKNELYNQSRKVQKLKEFKEFLELRKGFEDFQDEYYRRFQKKKETERVRYI